MKSGEQARDFTLQTVEGNSISLKDLRARGRTVIALFKVGCPTCQYTFPFLERLANNKKAQLVGISQDSAADTARFAKQFGITFPLAIDPSPAYSISKSFAIQTVPSIFVVEPDGNISYATDGWVKADMEELARRASPAPLPSSPPFFKAGESVLDFKAG